MRSNNITYVGDTDDTHNATDVVALLDRHAKDDPDAKLVVHTSARCPQGSLEWSIYITSPRGRRTLMASQRRPRGPVQLK